MAAGHITPEALFLGQQCQTDGGVYNNWFLEALEGSFALNLIVLAAAITYIDHSQGNQLAVGYTSVSIALATFISILGFQLANVIGVSHTLKGSAQLEMVKLSVTLSPCLTG